MNAPEIIHERPSTLLSLTEAHRAVLEVASLSFSYRHLNKIAPLGDGHAVMVLPGFLGDDGYNAAMRRFLRGLNYTVYGWGLGRNLGPRNGTLEGLESRLMELNERHSGPISLVGHSLGGIFSRELARAFPEQVRQVISLGSPFGKGRMESSVPARLFTALNPSDDLPVDQGIIHHAPPVPTTSIYTKGDGIVNWKTTLQHNGHDRSQNIQVRGSHCGLTLNPVIWYLVAERLSVHPEDWRPFQRAKWRNLFYPSAER